MIGPAFLAFVIAAAITTSELVTTEYPRTYPFLAKSRSLWAYALIYALIAFGVTLALGALVAAQVIKLEGLGLTSPWGQGIAVGVTVKALLHINLFTVRVGAQSSPFGLETLVQLFEPGLRRQILFDEDNAVKAYVQPLQGRYPDLVGVRARIKANIPAALPAAERAAFENDIDNAPTVERAAELFLRFAGRGTLARVFP